MKNSEGDKVTMPQRGPHISMNIFKGDGAHMENKVGIYSYTDACTHCNQVVGSEVVTGTCPQCYTEEPISPCKYANGVKQTWGVRQRKVHILMYAHILTKVWKQKWDDCKTHSATQWHPCFHITMHREWSRMELRTEIGINTCTDACTHPNHGVFPEIEHWNTHTVLHRGTHISI